MEESVQNLTMQIQQDKKVMTTTNVEDNIVSLNVKL